MPLVRSAPRPRRLPAPLLAIAVTITASAAVLARCPVATAAPVNLGNIMPLGDSITDGTGGTKAGYRDFLYTDLSNAGFTFTYVGSATDNSTSQLATAGQTHHEGHSGFVIQAKDPTDTGSGSGRSGVLDSINTWIGSGGANPNYILLMIGTNDVDLNYFPGTPPGSEQGNRLGTLISAISNKSTGLRPNAHLIVAQITPTGTAGENTRVQNYNTFVNSVVAQHAALGENVTMVDMYDALNPATDLTDNLHPNDSGYTKIANVWLQGIEAVPEPGCAALCGVISALALARRRRR